MFRNSYNLPDLSNRIINIKYKNKQHARHTSRLLIICVRNRKWSTEDKQATIEGFSNIHEGKLF